MQPFWLDWSLEIISSFYRFLHAFEYGIEPCNDGPCQADALLCNADAVTTAGSSRETAIAKLVIVHPYHSDSNIARSPS